MFCFIMDYYQISQSSAYGRPQSPSNFPPMTAQMVPPNTPVPLDLTRIPGLPPRYSPERLPPGHQPYQVPMQGLPLSVQAPVPSAYTATTPDFLASSHHDSRPFPAPIPMPEGPSESRRRALRRIKQALLAQLSQWSQWHTSNPSRLPHLSANDLLHPYGQISSSEVTQFWSTPEMEECSYLLTGQYNMGFHNTFTVFIPTLPFNLIPVAVASLLDPSFTPTQERRMQTYEIGTVVVTGEVLIHLRLAGDKIVLPCLVSDSTHVVCLGRVVQECFGLFYCPVLGQLVTSAGDRIHTIRLQTPWVSAP